MSASISANPSSGVGGYAPARPNLTLKLGASVAATWLVLLLELACVSILNARLFSGLWELRSGTLWLLPTLLVVSSIVALGAGLLWALAEYAQTRWVRVAIAALLALGAGAAAWAVGGGRHLASAAPRLGFACVVALGCGAVVHAFGPALARAIHDKPKRVAFGACAVILALELVNRFVLVRLYPAFHVALALATLFCVPGVCVAVLASPDSARRPPPRAERWLWALPAVVLGAAVLARPAARRLAYFDNFRLLLLDQAPLLSHGVHLAAALEPPAKAPEGPTCPDATVGCASDALPVPNTGSSVDLSGRDLLLITIDALRADHVKSYGYGRTTTPNLDALAERGTLFEYAYASTPHTSYSVTSIMTGKYMRPLLLQGAGQDSDTWAGLLRTYGYRTAAFYPPAVFFIDSSRFESFSRNQLGFEYAKVEFMEGQGRVDQVARYLRAQKPEQRVFVWVHLFGPHEPYEKQPGFEFGARDIDRYDSEIAAADASVGKLVSLFEHSRPNSVIIVSADHGEEFEEHGGRYHGTTVYEEQVRVPLVVAARGAIAKRRVSEPVQTIDLVTTTLAALQIPRPPRMRGRDLGPLLAGKSTGEHGFALAETEEQSLLAQDSLRLVCARKIGACKLYDVARDAREETDVSREHAERMREMRERQRELSASHGRFEERGLRAEGKGWPPAILRGAAGDGDAAEEIAALLDDADLSIRRKAAELLFELSRQETAPALRLALARDEDPDVRSYAALALTRFGQGAPLSYELVKSGELRWRRLAALALAQAGDERGEEILIAWWRDEKSRDYDRSRELLNAFAAIRSKDALYPLTQSLHDVRLRPFIAATLAAIGDEAARGFLARALKEERYQSARVALCRALVDLKAEGELIEPLIRFLGVPDPLPDGLDFARRAKILEYVGGPSEHTLSRLKKESALGVALSLFVPRGGNGQGVRALIRAKNFSSDPAVVRLGARRDAIRYNSKGEPVNSRDIPRIDTSHQLEFRVPAGDKPSELHAILPANLGVRAGHAVELVLFADRAVEIEALAIVPLADELPAPAPEPWQGGSAKLDTAD